MRISKILILLLTVVMLGFYACKKDDTSGFEVVQKQIIGKWPIKYRVQTTFTNNVETKNDTLIRYSPIDTLVFTADGHAIRQNKTVISTVAYSISEDGEYITLASTPANTLKITFVRKNSIGLGTETVTQVSGKEIKTQIADHLVK